MEVSKLISYIKGSASKSDAREVIEWIEASEQNRRKFSEIKNLWALTPPIEYFNSLPISEFKVRTDIITGKHRKQFVLNFAKYAAAIVFIILASSITFLITNSRIEKKLRISCQTITTLYGQTSEISFPDGSVATLNSGSSIRYSSDYTVNKRLVKLEGEAIFDVKSNPEIPFTVKARGIIITAKGTIFNVDAYPTDKEMNITLIEGHVSISDSNGRFLSKIYPYENARIDMNTKKLNISEVDPDNYLSWQKGIIIFKDKSFEDIAKDLERCYNVSIEFSDQRMREVKYSGAILKNKPIDQVLEVLKLTSNFEYHIDIKDNEPNIVTIK